MFLRSWVLSVFLLVMGVMLCSGGPAQAKSAGVSSEQAQSVWTLQARHAAGKLGLSKEQTAKLVDAYRSARKSYSRAAGKVWRKPAKGKKMSGSYNKAAGTDKKWQKSESPSNSFF